MIALAVAAAMAALAALILAVRRTRVAVSLAARLGDGAWAVAGGGALGPIAVTGARAAGGPGSVAVRLFGRSLPAPRATRGGAAGARLATAFRRIDPFLAVELALDAFGRVRIEALSADVRCGLVDPTTAGRAAQLLAVLSGMAAPIARVRHAIDWSAEDDALDLKIEATASFVPALLLSDLIVFAVRHVRLLRYARGR